MAVYTAVTDDDLTAFLAEYAIGEPLSFKGIAEGVENSNYLLRTDQAEFILTLYEKRVDAGDLPFFLGLMEHLAARGAPPCAAPVKGRDGVSLRALCGRPAAIVTFLDGLSPRRVGVEHCAALGPALAQLHESGRDFGLRRPNDLSLAGWTALMESAGPAAGTLAAGLEGEMRAELDALTACWPAPGALPEGVIHADLFPDNAFFAGRGETVRLTGVIDFYFACNDMFAYDLAICVNAWCFEPDGAFNVTKARRLIAGYESVRALTCAERNALPALCRGAALRFALTRLHDWVHTPQNALVTPKDPMPFIRRLRFHRAASGPEAYGL